MAAAEDIWEEGEGGIGEENGEDEAEISATFEDYADEEAEDGDEDEETALDDGGGLGAPEGQEDEGREDEHDTDSGQGESGDEGGSGEDEVVMEATEREDAIGSGESGDKEDKELQGHEAELAEADAPAAELAKNLHAALASNDSERQLAALALFRYFLKRPDSWEILLEYKLISPQWGDLLQLWELQHSSIAMKISTMLVLLLTDLIRHPSALMAPQLSQPPGSEKAAGVAWINELAHAICQKHMRVLYSHLSSGQRNRVNSVLILLTSIASRSKVSARELAATFDFNLAALPKIAAQPRQSHKVSPVQEDFVPPPSMILGHNLVFDAAVLETVSNVQPLKEKILPDKTGTVNSLAHPTRVFYVDFALSFLVVGDPAVVRSVLQKRTFFTAILHSLATDHPIIILRFLKVLRGRVMAASTGVPRGLQGAFFGDGAVEQIMKISAFGDGKSDAVTTAAQLAHRILLALFTDPSHGICHPTPSPQPPSPYPTAAAAYTDSEHFQKAGLHSHVEKDARGGLGRLLRLSLRLRVTEVKRHAELLLVAAKMRPALAGTYLASVPFSLEPRVSERWFAAITIVTQLIRIASEVPLFPSSLPVISRPSADSPMFRSAYRRICPPNLPKAALSRGLQHGSALVKYACVCALVESLHALEKVLAELAIRSQCSENRKPFEQLNSWRTSAAGHTDNHIWRGSLEVGELVGSSVSEGQQIEESHTDSAEPKGADVKVSVWAELSQTISETLRVLLPDPQILIALNKALDRFENDLLLKRKSSTKGDKVASNRKREWSGGDQSTGIGGETQQQDSQEREVGERGVHAVSDLNEAQRLEGALGAKASATQKNVTDSLRKGQEGEAMADELGDVMKDEEGVERTLGELLEAQVLAALAGYQRCIPQSLADCRFDPFKLLPKDPLMLPLIRQRGVIAILSAAIMPSTPYHAPLSPSSGPASLTVPASVFGKFALWTYAGPLYQHCLPLMHLFLGSEDAAVRAQAQLLVWAAFVSTGAFDSDVAEISLWLEGLPSLRSNHAGGRETSHKGEGSGGGRGRQGDISEREEVEKKRWDGKESWREAVVNFLADAVGAVGRNPYKFWEEMHAAMSARHEAAASAMQGATAVEEDFSQLTSLLISPLAVCALSNAMRVARSTSGNLGFPQRAAIVGYSASVLDSMLLVQPEPSALAALIRATLAKESHLPSPAAAFQCEWAPLQALLLMAEQVLEASETVHVKDSFFETSVEDENGYQEVVKKAKRKAGEVQDLRLLNGELHDETRRKGKGVPEQLSGLEAVLDTALAAENLELGTLLLAAENAFLVFPSQELGANLGKLLKVCSKTLEANVSVLPFLLKSNSRLIGDMMESKPSLVKQALELARKEKMGDVGCKIRKRRRTGQEMKGERSIKRKKGEQGMGVGKGYEMSESGNNEGAMESGPCTDRGGAASILATAIRETPFVRLLAAAIRFKEGHLLDLEPMRAVLLEKCENEVLRESREVSKAGEKPLNPEFSHSFLEVSSKCIAVRAVLSGIRHILNRWRVHERGRGMGLAGSAAQEAGTHFVEELSQAHWLRRLAVLFSVLEAVVIGESKMGRLEEEPPQRMSNLKARLAGESSISLSMGILNHPMFHAESVQGAVEVEAAGLIGANGKVEHGYGEVKDGSLTSTRKRSSSAPKIGKKKGSFIENEGRGLEDRKGRNGGHKLLTMADRAWSLFAHKFVLRVLTAEDELSQISADEDVSGMHGVMKACSPCCGQAAERLRSWLVSLHSIKESLVNQASEDSGETSISQLSVLGKSLNLKESSEADMNAANAFVRMTFTEAAADEQKLEELLGDESISLWMDAFLASYCEPEIITGLLMEALRDCGHHSVARKSGNKVSIATDLHVTLYLATALFRLRLEGDLEVKPTPRQGKHRARQIKSGSGSYEDGQSRELRDGKVEGMGGMYGRTKEIEEPTVPSLLVSGSQSQGNLSVFESKAQSMLFIYRKIASLSLEQPSEEVDNFLLSALEASSAFPKFRLSRQDSPLGRHDSRSVSWFPLVLGDQELIAALPALPNLSSSSPPDLARRCCHVASPLGGALAAALARADGAHRREVGAQLLALSTLVAREGEGSSGIGGDLGIRDVQKKACGSGDSRSLSALLPVIDVYLTHQLDQLRILEAGIANAGQRKSIRMDAVKIAKLGRRVALDLVLDSEWKKDSADFSHALRTLGKSLIFCPLKGHERHLLVRKLVPKGGWALPVVGRLKQEQVEPGSADFRHHAEVRVEEFESIYAQAVAAYFVVVGFNPYLDVCFMEEEVPSDDETDENKNGGRKAKDHLRFVGSLMNTLLAIYRANGAAVTEADGTLHTATEPEKVIGATEANENLRRGANPFFSLAGRNDLDRKHRGGRNGSEVEEHDVGQFEHSLMEMLTHVAYRMDERQVGEAYLAALRTFVIGSLKHAFARAGPMELVRLLLVAAVGIVKETSGGKKSSEARESNISCGSLHVASLARLGHEFFHLVVSHSLFASVIFSPPLGSEKPLPEVMGRATGKDERWGTLSSVCSLMDTPFAPAPVQGIGFDKDLQREVHVKDHVLAHGRRLSGQKSVGGSLGRSTMAMDRRHVRKVWDLLEDKSHNRLKSLHRTKGGNVGELQKLEIVNLLHVFLHMRSLHVTGFEALEDGQEDVALDDVLGMLMTAYGATMSELDCQIFTVLRTIEGYGGAGFSGMSGMDYLWGEGALKRMRDRQVRRKASSISGQKHANGEDGDEAGGRSSHGLGDENAADEPTAVYQTPEELLHARRRKFREELAIDPKRCGLTALFFSSLVSKCSSSGEEKEGASTGFDGINTDMNKEMMPIPGTSAHEEMELQASAYDPHFILLMALHALSHECLSLCDFARLGLLSVALASLSSSIEALRRLGYDILGTYSGALEISASFKERAQLQLLVRFVRNAVAEPFQRLPAVSAVFAAEAACVVVHSDSLHYTAVNKALLHRPALDLEDVPLFFQAFRSGAMQTHRAERTWMLRQLAAGLASPTDAKVFRKRFVVELLMSFWGGQQTDAYTRKLILQVVRKGAQIPQCAADLAENAGLLPWLARAVASAAASSERGVQGAGEKEAREMVEAAAMAVEIIELVLHVPNIQRRALGEGFTDLSYSALLLHRILSNPSTPPPFRTALRQPVLRVLGAALEISLHRRPGSFTCQLSVSELLAVLMWGGREEVAQEGGLCLDTSLEARALCLQVLLKNGIPKRGPMCEAEETPFLEVGLWAVSHALEIPHFSLWDSRLGLVPLHLNVPRVLEEGGNHVERTLLWVSFAQANLVNGGFENSEGTDGTPSQSKVGGQAMEQFPARGQASIPRRTHGNAFDVRRLLLAKGLLTLHARLGDADAQQRCLDPLNAALKALLPDSM